MTSVIEPKFSFRQSRNKPRGYRVFNRSEYLGVVVAWRRGWRIEGENQQFKTRTDAAMRLFQYQFEGPIDWIC